MSILTKAAATHAVSGIRGGGHNRKKIIYYSYLQCLLWFIADITDVYFEKYGAFTREIVTLKILSQIRPYYKNPNFFVEHHPNWDLMDIIEFLLWNITENYGP